MAPSAGAVAALAVLALPAVASLQYNYTAGGQDWNKTSGWGTCGTGQNQSPINIADSTTVYSVSYGKSTAWTLEVTVNYLEVANIDTVTTGNHLTTANAFTDGITLDGTFIPLNQFHFHSPSEHTINGVHYPLEMHMVHKLFQASPTNTTIVPSNASPTPTLAKAAVIGIMFAYDPADADGAFMAKLIPAMQAVTLAGADDSDDTSFNTTSDMNIDTTYGGNIFFNITSDVFGVIGTSDYYRYNGSLTTPPCTEGINWINMANPMTLSSRQLLAFTQLLATEQAGTSRGSDNRLIQPINSRVIYTSVEPPPPTLVSGSLTFNTNLSASQMSALDDELAAALADQLGVDTSDVIISSFTDVPGASGSGLDVKVLYSIAAASPAAATVVSQAIAAGSLTQPGVTMSSMAAALASAYPNLGIASMSAAPPASSTSTDPSVSFAAVTAANAALTANVLSLTAAAALTQANISVTMAALRALVAASMSPPALTVTYVTVTHTLGGYTTATFGSAQAAQFAAALAQSVGLTADAVTITSVTDVPASGHRRHRRKALAVADSAHAGRALLATGGGVAVASSIRTTSPTVAASVSAALVATPLTAATLQSMGLASCTGVVVTTPPATVTTSTQPVDATATLPPSSPEVVAASSGPRLLLLLILLLLLLPIAAAVAYVLHRSSKANAGAGAAPEGSPTAASSSPGGRGKMAPGFLTEDAVAQRPPAAAPSTFSAAAP